MVLVTQVLLYALENSIIDGVLVTKMNKKNPLHPEVFIAKKKSDIISASKSKYCPVPLNSALKEISESKGKFAVVGLPCHIQGLRKAIRVNPLLKERITLFLGLMCSYNRNFYATQYLLDALKINPEKVQSLEYRGRGYPGKYYELKMEIEK